MTATTREDLLAPDFLTNPHPAYGALRADGPVHKVVLQGDMSFWLVTRYEDARQAFTDPRLVKAGTISPPWFATLPPHLQASLLSSMLSFDPPDHTRLRRLVASVFTHHRIQGLRPRIQAITDDLLDDIAGVEGADIVERLAFPLATRVIFEMLGVHGADQDRFQRLSDKITAGTTPPDELEEVAAEFVDFVRDLIEDKRANPGEDLLSAMIAVRDGGDRLSDDELCSTTFLLLVAGQVTTVDLIGNGVYLLLSERSRWESLRADRGGMTKAIDEFLRFEAPVQISGARITAEPVDFSGTVVPAGEVVIVGLMASNRDEARYPDADLLDLTRSDNQHLAFGHGIHRCIGAPLAMLEADIAFNSLMDRFPDLDLAEPAAEVEWRPTFSIRGPAHLPVTGT